MEQYGVPARELAGALVGTLERALRVSQIGLRHDQAVSRVARRDLRGCEP